MSESYSTIPVESRPIDGFPKYRVGIDGSVWSSWNNRWSSDQWTRINGTITDDGYVAVELRDAAAGVRKSRLVHALVLEAFEGPCPDGCETRHLDGCRTNNVRGNLTWGTPTQNADDMVRHNTRIRGRQKYGAKLTEQAVIDIRNSPEKGYVLAAKYGVAKSVVSRVRRRRIWTHI